MLYILRYFLKSWCTIQTRKRGRAQRKDHPLLPPSECYRLNASRLNYHHVARFSMGLNCGPIFRHLWTKIHQIMSADAGEVIACNAVFRLSISCSVPEIFAIEVWSRPKSRQKSTFFGPQIFLGGGPPNFGPSLCTHFRSCGKVSRQSAETTAEISHWIKKERN